MIWFVCAYTCPADNILKSFFEKIQNFFFNPLEKGDPYDALCFPRAPVPLPLIPLARSDRRARQRRHARDAAARAVLKEAPGRRKSDQALPCLIYSIAMDAGPPLPVRPAPQPFRPHASS